jgi:hypothetical protein
MLRQLPSCCPSNKLIASGSLLTSLLWSQGASDTHGSDQYDPIAELQRIQRVVEALSEGEVQVGCCCC